MIKLYYNKIYGQLSQTYIVHTIFEVITEVLMKIQFLWDTVSC
jgi:hypothetical protein